MRNLLSPLLLLFSTITFSQGIVVDTTSLTVPQLVQDVLMQNSCSNETNFIFSSHRGIGQFTNSNPGFPISNGIIIRNGIAKDTEGSYTGLNESSQITTASDPDLQAISDANGQSAAITDVAFIQYDFTPISTKFSFDFLFASNEYGQYQCGFSDVFAFILTDLTTGTTTNLAVIPSTTIPVSVKNIRDDAYNSSCISANSNLFSQYNVADPANSAINMRGETVLLEASAAVIPNRTYRIKLAIGDYNDEKFDSAVFIQGGSFITTTDLGPDKIICQGESYVLDSGLDSPYTFSWTRNGATIPGENSSTLTAFQAGTYGVIATLAGCVITDEIVLSDFIIPNTPNDLLVCNTGQPTHQFDLTQNNIGTLGLNPVEYSVLYFASLADANANGPQIPLNELTSYSSAGNQTIYIKVIHLPNGNAICDNLLSFKLVVSPFFNSGTPPDLNFCDNFTGAVTVNLSTQNTAILNGQNPAGFIISYFSSQTDATTNTNVIVNPSAFLMTIAQSPKTIWTRMEDVTNPSCFQIVSFSITIYPQPPVDDIADVIECSSYTLPPITNGNYYTGPNGTGTLLHAGDLIDSSGTFYILNGPIAPNGCTNESTFVLNFVDEMVFANTACGRYIIPVTPAGNFYTGPSGTGTLLSSGTVLTTDQTIYFYAILNGVVCRNDAHVITIYPLPPIDNPVDVAACDSYTLPPLTNGNYYTESGGAGTLLNAGDLITVSQDIYVFALSSNGCKSEKKIRVDIIVTSIYQPIVACGSYTLPAVAIGNYYDQPLGGGNIIPAGTVITSSQTVYYYVAMATSPNCTDNLNFSITINQLPLVDTPSDRLECQSYTLPPLTNGNYFTGSNGSGTPLFAGQIITSSKIIYIYADNGTCTNQHSFLVRIRALPPVDSFTDIFTCVDFILPNLTYGNYYTASGGPHGSGVPIAPGTVINTTQTIFIYNEWNDFTSCSNESYFLIDANGVDVGTFADVNSCDSYTLPPITIGDYYTQPNGQGVIIPAGTVLTTSQTIYVYIKVGTRLTCTDQDDFQVFISKTPTLTSLPDVEACGSYTLPTLLLGNYFSGPNGSGTPYIPGQQIPASQTMYVYTTAPANLNCKAQDDFNITVHPLKNITIAGGVICVDYVTGNLTRSFEIVSGLDPVIFTVEWYLNNTLMGTGPNYIATQEGTYNVVIIKNTPDIGDDCGYNPTTVLIEKSSPATATVTVTDAFDDDINVVVDITGGYGIYDLQMDGGAFQTSTVFYNVASGEKTITVRDIKGSCGSINLIAHVFNYPKYFTPNNDGFHDTWNIWALDIQPTASIYIFDRYGKFLKELSPAGEGWDGTFNGQPLPSTDYWFTVYYNKDNLEQVFKAHFSMKR